LIEDAGLKGFTSGNARVSEKHANFLVALPGAKAADILALAAEIKRRVREQSGHELVEEVRLLGF
jgi:UDP-N-acetylmuramate dehydrogenase